MPEEDENGNIVAGDVTIVDSKNCVVNVAEGRHIALLGVEDLIIVEDGHGIIIRHRSHRHGKCDS